MRQKRWLELLKDYDCEILYHLGKVIVVADALSRRGASTVAVLVQEWSLLEQLSELTISNLSSAPSIYCAFMAIHLDLVD